MADDCAQRWTAERDRLRTYRRQRATIHCGELRTIEEMDQDAAFLDDSIAKVTALMDAILDEHNGHQVREPA